MRSLKSPVSLSISPTLPLFLSLSPVFHTTLTMFSPTSPTIIASKHELTASHPLARSLRSSLRHKDRSPLLAEAPIDSMHLLSNSEDSDIEDKRPLPMIGKRRIRKNKQKGVKRGKYSPILDAKREELISLVGNRRISIRKVMTFSCLPFSSSY